MAALVTENHEPFQDGLGKASVLGVGFLRRKIIDMNGSLTVTIPKADLVANKIYCVQSIVMKTAHTAYVSAQTDDSLTITASNNAALLEVFVLCAGI